MKKGKDSREIFAVFKKGSFMEGAAFGEKFSYWFKNVFMYHLALPTAAIVLVVILGINLVVSIVNREYRDLDYILGGSVFANIEQMGELSDYFAGFIDEKTGKNGEPVPPTVGHQMLCTESALGTGDQALAIDEYNAASIDKISVSMADDEILLFIFDRKYAEWYEKEGAFEPLSTFGIESENGYYVRIDELPKIKEIGVLHRDGIYAAIKIITPAREKDERIMQKYENAAAVLRGLISGS